MKIEFVSNPEPDDRLTGAAIGVFADGNPVLPQTGRSLPAPEALQALIARRGFKAGADQVMEVSLPGAVDIDRALLFGLGPRAVADELIIEEAGAHAFAALRTSGVELLEIYAPELSPDQAARLGFGARLAGYSFDRRRTAPNPAGVATIQSVRVVTDDPTAAATAYAPLAALARAVEFARDLVSEPPNILSPAEFAARLQPLSEAGLKVEVLGEKQLRALGMGALLGVGQGSPCESQLAVLRWDGGVAGAAPVALVGKGVCFDSGGLSLKAKLGMEEMKWDMAGAAAVTGAMLATAARKAPINVVAVLGLVENMPDGRAQRPSDVVTSMSGQTIEVVNTDAEGRLVLADALWYAQQEFEPCAVIDVATLTGAIQVALGTDCAGVFSNDDALASDLVAASNAEGERLWRMPLIATYEKHIRSFVADVKNLGDPHGEAISAALFLQRFIRNRPWAHIDMAASAWRKTSTRFSVPDGATGFGVRILTRMLADRAGEQSKAAA